MKIRAWLNDDPNSNEMKTYIVPEDCRWSWDFNDRFVSYENERKKHVKQMENEVIGLALICKKHGIYKDLFELLRDEYIFRPVEKKKTEEEEKQKYFTRALKWCITFTLILIGLLFYLIIFKIVEPPRSTENYLNNYNVIGLTGPPGICCNIPSAPGLPGPTGPPGL